MVDPPPSDQAGCGTCGLEGDARAVLYVSITSGSRIASGQQWNSERLPVFVIEVVGACEPLSWSIHRPIE
jgi:hypothetical protein